MGGFIGGMIAGAVVVLIAGAVVSLNTPLASKPEVAAQAPQPAPVAEVPAEADVAADGSDADLVKLPPRGPKVAEEVPDTVAELADIETAPDTQPTITDDIQQIEQPGAVETPEVAATANPPAIPSAPAALPVVPQNGAEPVTIDQTPPPSPAPEETEVATLEPEPEPEPESAALTLPEVTDTPAESEEENPFENSPIAVEGDEDALPRALPRIAALPQIGGEQTTQSNTIVGKRVLPLTDRDDEPVAADAPVETVPGKPIEAFAASFENPESKPLMSIILIDDEGAFGAEALQDFPYPISFAVSPSDPDATEKMARHRAAGFEVLALADLPEAASAQDAEVSLAVWLDTLPETVGILEGTETGIQGNRKLADQVAAIAGGTGRGLITQDNGLNTVQKLAARNGIPSGVVFRDIDGARQDPKIMRRFLDQAAFRAGQEGTVVMLGRVRPETISALLLWGLEDRGSRVAMAPISAVMMTNTR